MITFLRLLPDSNKSAALQQSCILWRNGETADRVFETAEDAFDTVPGKPFAYWVSQSVRAAFTRLPRLEGADFTARQGLATADDFRFLRCWWEIAPARSATNWPLFAKGGAYSPFYADVYLVLDWMQSGAQIKNNLNEKGNVRSNVWMLRDTELNFFFRPGITWSRRTQGGLSLRALPAGCIFADKGPAAFSCTDDPQELLALLALSNSRAFGLLVSLQMAFGSYEVGVIQRTPLPMLLPEQSRTLAALTRRAWSRKRCLDSTTETSHAFLLPAVLLMRAGNFDKLTIEAELTGIQAEIDAVVFDLYGFSQPDRRAALGQERAPAAEYDAEAGEEDDDDSDDAADNGAALLSWAVGVAFGHFDLRLATGERPLPPEPEPFDPLPAKSPSMLPDSAEPFHSHAGILVDDQGHRHDLVRLVERVLDRVDMPVPPDLRRWLQRDFFPFHLQRYSKSRRKAPIYWPLATASGGYTLWLYYPALSRQTLYSAINDFVDPKLTDVASEANQLRTKGSVRRSDEERRLEALATLEHELRDLRDQLQTIVSEYHPNHDDGVQITAAPLWPLFRHKPWQKILRDTWTKLGKGDYDWSHLAMHYRPDYVREQCRTDKSLAIAHGLEELYMEPAAKQKNSKGPKGSAI